MCFGFSVSKTTTFALKKKSSRIFNQIPENIIRECTKANS